MGISTALQAAHNDDLHTGNAKRAAASGLASLDAASKVVQEPATKGAASGIAPLDAGSKVAVANLPVNVASGIAGLDASSRVQAAQLALAELLANKNAASGYAGLDASSRVDQTNSFLPSPNLSVARSLTTEYQNGNRPRIIDVYIYINIGATVNSQAMAIFGAKISSPVNTYFGSVGTATGMAANGIHYFHLSGIVPANWYYKITSIISGTGSVTLNNWNECDL
jgi:hypothetical protein